MSIVSWLSSKGIVDLVSFLHSHKIVGRVLSEIEKGNSVIDEETESVIREMQKKISIQCSSQIKAIEEIQCMFPREHMPLAIKGVSAAIICNTPQHFRRSRDVDLFYDDVAALKEILISLGYTQVEATAAPHEDSFFVKDLIKVEVHKYFPIVCNPDYDRGKFNFRRQAFLSDALVNRLEYNDLLSHSIFIKNEIASGITVTDIEMTIFTLCAHVYKDLFWEPYKATKVKLAELFEIHDLTNLDDFNYEKLLSIAHKLGAEHIITYVFTIIEETFHVKMAVEFHPETNPLVKLMNDSYSPYKVSDSAYLGRLPFLSFEETLHIVGVAKCMMNDFVMTQNLMSTYYASTKSDFHDFAFKVHRKNEQICFEISVNWSLSSGDNFCILMDGSVFTHIWFDDYPECIRVYGVNKYDVCKSDTGYIVRCFFDNAGLSPLYAILAVGKSSDALTAVTVVAAEVLG